MRSRLQHGIMGCAASIALTAAGVLYAQEDIESWSSAGLSGWVAAPPATLSNPGGYLKMSFAKCTLPMPDECLAVAGTNASGGIFVGDYRTRGGYALSFRFILANSQVPSAFMLRMKSAVSGWEWVYPLTIPPGGVWTNYRVPISFDAGWRHGASDSQQKFADDLRNIEWVGVHLLRGTATNNADYGLDDFTLSVHPTFAINKSIVSPADRAAVSNDLITFRLTVTNTGELALGPIAVTDLFETAYLEYTSAIPVPSTIGAGVLVWTNLGSVAIGDLTNILVTFRAVATTMPDERTNVVLGVLDTTNDYPVVVNADAAPYRIAAPGFLVTKTQTIPAGGVAAIGDPVEFVIAVTNSGDMALEPVTLDDSYETNRLLYQSAAPAPDTVSPGRLAWTNLGFIAPDGYIVVTTRFSAVLSTQPGLTTNLAIAGATVTNGVVLPPVTNSGTVRVVAPAIDIVKTAGYAPDGEDWSASSGASVAYSYVVTNTGDTYLSDVTVTDDVLGVVGALGSPLAPGASATLTAPGTVTSDVVNIGVVVGTPSAPDGAPYPGIAKVTASDDASVVMAYLMSAIEALPEPVLAGRPLTYTLWIANPSPRTVTNVVVSENYPAAFIYATARPLPSAGDNTWNLGDLPPGEVVKIVVSGRIAAGTGAGTQLTNSFVVTAPQIGANRVEDSAPVAGLPAAGEAVILVTKRDSVDPITNGTIWSYTVRVENNSAVAASNVLVTETYPGNFQYLGASLTPQAGGSNTWLLTVMQPHTYVEITITGVLARALSPGCLVENRVLVTASNAPPSDDREITVVQDGPQVQVVKIATPDPVLAGQILTYTVSVSNVSLTMAATNVVVVDHFDRCYAYLSAIPAPRAGTSNAWDIGTLSPGAATTIVIRGRAMANGQASNVLFNTVEVVTPRGSRAAHATTVAITPAAAGDRVWEDFNADNLFQGEIPSHIGGSQVRLFAANGTLVAATTAGASGHYLFTNLWPGAYYIKFKAPARHVFVIRDFGSDDTIDSDAKADGRTAVFTLQAGETNLTLDAGVVEVGVLGDFVWVDSNHNGSPADEDMRQMGINGVTVTLYRVTGTVTSRVARTVTMTDIAGRKGFYLFSGLPSGRYLVKTTGGVPPSLDVRTTVAQYLVDIGSNTFYLSADFGFISGEPPFELRYFRAVDLGNSVRLEWSTAVELNVAGFNILRKERQGGALKRITAQLIPAVGGVSGTDYRWVDRYAPQNTTFVYWLEEIDRDRTSESFGPVIRWGRNSSGRQPQVLAGFFAAFEGGLYKIGYEVLKAAGLSMNTIDPTMLAVRVDGRDVPIYVSAAEGELMRPGDYVLCYVPGSVNAVNCELTLAPEPSRMRLVPVPPSIEAGDVWVGQVGPTGALELQTDPDYVRYIVVDFNDTPVWLLDITARTNAMLLYGYSYVMASNGLTAIYFSYTPTNGPARCFVIQDNRVIDVETLVPGR